MNDLVDIFEANKEAVAKSASYIEFLHNLDIAKALLAHRLKYASEWNERHFQTYAKHGYTHKPLAFPGVTKLSELFDRVELHNINTGNQMYKGDATRAHGNLAFVIGLRSTHVPFGYVGDDYYISEHKNGEFFCFGQGRGKTVGTYAAPSTLVKAFLDVKDNHAFAMAFTFEAVKRSDGKTLIIANREFGGEWLALIKISSDFENMLPKAQWDEYAATKAREAIVQSCVDGKTIDRERAAQHNVQVRTRRH